MRVRAENTRGRRRRLRSAARAQVSKSAWSATDSIVLLPSPPAVVAPTVRSWDAVTRDTLMMQVKLEYPDGGGCPTALEMQADLYALRMGLMLQHLYDADHRFHGSDHPKSPVPKTVAMARRVVGRAVLLTVDPETMIRNPPHLDKFREFYKALKEQPVRPNVLAADDRLWSAISGLANDQPPSARLELVKIATSAPK